MPLKILFTEGSSTSARQSLYALGRLGHVIDVCDPQRLCLTRFSRYVRRLYRCPSFTRDPLGYLDFLRDRLDREHYDVLLPVHDQVYLLSRFPEAFYGRTGLALAPFESVVQLQSKAGFARLLAELELPQPRTTVVAGPAEVPAACSYPCYVKLEYSTAGRGVWRVDSPRELQPVLDALERIDEQDRGQIVVQEAVAGEFHAAQAVCRHGELVGAGCYRSLARGVGGSAHARESVTQPAVYEHLARLGRRLAWHGAFHVEYLCDPATGSPTYIEANPRIGETMNATLGGANLCEALVRVSLGERLAAPVFARPGVRTHSVLMALMGAAEGGEGRRGVLAELRRWRRREGAYHDSEDELVRPGEDPRALLPAVFVTAQLLAAPSRTRQIVRRAVDNYALDARAVRAIAELFP
jgi:predicted ATP-grasp superfamily ATP-dependent carboligase